MDRTLNSDCEVVRWLPIFGDSSNILYADGEEFGGDIKMNKNKTRRIEIRCREMLFRKLWAICQVSGKTKTAVLEDLICKEFDRRKAYQQFYDANLLKKL